MAQHVGSLRRLQSLAATALFALLALPAAAAAISISCGGHTIGQIHIDEYVLTGEVAGVDGGTQNKGPWGARMKARFVFDDAFECPENETFCGTFRWIQWVRTNAPSDKWGSDPAKYPPQDSEGFYGFIDPWAQELYDGVYPLKDADPFYLTETIRRKKPNWIGNREYDAWFADSPARDEKNVGSYPGVPVKWTAETALVCVVDHQISFLGSFVWGWERYQSQAGSPNTFTKTPLTSGPVSSTLIAKATDAKLFPGWSASADCCCCPVPEPTSLLLLGTGLMALLGWARRRPA